MAASAAAITSHGADFAVLLINDAPRFLTTPVYLMTHESERAFIFRAK